MITIGIDIGLTGAVALIDAERQVLEDIPTTNDARGKRLDGWRLIRLLRELAPVQLAAQVVFEDVRPRPNPARGTSIITEGSLMRSRGIVEAVLDIMRPAHVHIVTPQAWKRHFGLIGAKKDGARELALKLYPQTSGVLARKKDHNRADALLLAHYAKTVL